jgi:putative FmdB family regulatory protein
MPTYEYECEKCGHRFELFQKMTDKPKSRCPKCRGKVRRLIGTGAGIVFKGSGFYTTDYRSKSYKEQQKKESGGSAAAKDEAPKKPAKPAKPAKPSTPSTD